MSRVARASAKWLNVGMGYGRLRPRVAGVPDVVAVCGVWEMLGGLEGGGGGKLRAIGALCEPGHQDMSVALAPRLLEPSPLGPRVIAWSPGL